MSKISCNVCMDLIPLIKDGVASEDSRLLVEQHIAHCKQCEGLVGGGLPQPDPMDEAAVLGKIKKQLLFFTLGMMLAGTLLGMAISDGMHLFYNALIMPAIGGMGYLLLKRKAYLVPLALFLFSFAWILIREISNGGLAYTNLSQICVLSASMSAILAGFAAVGILIGALLYYAFKKEDQQ